MIDPTKEIPAMINGIRGGLISLSEVHRQSGFNSDSLLEEIAKDNARLDALGIVIDSDPRKTMKAGTAQAYIEQVPEPDVTAQ
jgi:capsid protein